MSQSLLAGDMAFVAESRKNLKNSTKFVRVCEKEAQRVCARRKEIVNVSKTK